MADLHAISEAYRRIPTSGTPIMQWCLRGCSERQQCCKRDEQEPDGAGQHVTSHQPAP